MLLTRVRKQTLAGASHGAGNMAERIPIMEDFVYLEFIEPDRLG